MYIIITTIIILLLYYYYIIIIVIIIIIYIYINISHPLTQYISFPEPCVSCILLKPAPEPSGQNHQNLTFSPPKIIRMVGNRDPVLQRLWTCNISLL